MATARTRTIKTPLSQRHARRPALVLIVIVVAAAVIAAAVLVRGGQRGGATAASAKQTARGLDYYKSGDFAKAIPALKRAVKLNPNSAKAQRTLGMSLEAVGDLGQATKAYKASLVAQPNQFQVLYNLAIIYESQRRNDQAIEALQQAVNLNGRFVAARLALAGLYARTNQKAKARQQYEAVIELKPFGIDLEWVKTQLQAVR